MSDVAENEGGMDFSKMKVNDLKKLLKSRGLSAAGVKQDLIERLQSSEAAAEALLEGEVGEDGFDEELDKELDESALMADEEHTDDIPASNSTENKDQKENTEEPKPHEESTPPSSSPKKSEDCKEPSQMDVDQNGSTDVESQASKQVKLSLKPQPLSLTEADKKKARAERFGTTQKDQTSSMAKRAERFSLNKDTTSKAADSSTSQTKVTSTTTNELLKRRAERFGILSPAEIKRQHLEKLQARKLRFQQSTSPPTEKAKITTVTTSSSTAPTTTTTTTNGTKVSTSLTLQERKRLRAERFKITT